MGKLKPFMAAVVAVGLLYASAHTATADSRADKMNQNTLGLMAADPQWLGLANNIAATVQHEQGLRVLPIVGAGTLQAVSDLAYLDRVDAALLPLDTLTYAQAQGLLQGLDGKVTYLVRLQSIKWALVVGKGIDSLADLAGKRVATGPTGSMGFVAGELLFNASDVSFARVPRQNAGSAHRVVARLCGCGTGGCQRAEVGAAGWEALQDPATGATEAARLYLFPDHAFAHRCTIAHQ